MAAEGLGEKCVCVLRKCTECGLMKQNIIKNRRKLLKGKKNASKGGKCSNLKQAGWVKGRSKKDLMGRI